MGRVLIVGAGIAGMALALFLERDGHEVTVVELAAGLRTGGQTIDLRGAGATVIERLGLMPACRERLVEQRGIAWVDADGHRLAQMPVEAFGGRGFVSDAELLRSDLAHVLHDAAGAQVSYRYDDTVTALVPTQDAVTVSFRGDPTATFDLVVGADGSHSLVRQLAFGPEEEFRRPLGLAHAWFTMPTQQPDLDGWFLVHNAPGSRAVGLRPGHPGEMEAGLTFAATTLPARRDRVAQLDLLRRTFDDVGWRTHELLDAAPRAADFALDTVDQMAVDQWSRGRVVLLGDSAWCSSPLSGMGTAVALVGAYVLAGQLRAAGGTGPGQVETALAAYEASMRPEAATAQRLLPGRVGSVAPRTARGIWANAAVMRLVQVPPVQAGLTWLVGRGRPATLPALSPG